MKRPEKRVAAATAGMAWVWPESKRKMVERMVAFDPFELRLQAFVWDNCWYLWGVCVRVWGTENLFEATELGGEATRTDTDTLWPKISNQRNDLFEGPACVHCVCEVMNIG